MINDILDFSKIEAGKLELEPIEFNLRDTLSEALKAMALRAHAKGLELACEVADEVQDAMIGDPGRLRQVLINLVGNAIKFTEAGEVVIEVRLEPSPPHDQPAQSADDRSTGSEQLVLFSVTDTGIGIPAEKQHLIFEAFTQADGTMTRKFGGTGLGLSISRRLVELMGGRIWLESEPGKGTAFHFSLRLTPSKTTISSVTPPGLVELRGLRVLVVDDNATNRRILEKTLLGWAMKPTLTDSGLRRRGHEAATMENQPFSLVLLDVMMPEMDGFAVLRQIRDDLELVGATIMMLSSAAQLSDVARREELNLSSYLVKPVRQSELLDAIRKSLSRTVATLGKTPVPLAKPGEIPKSSLRILLADDHVVNQKLAVRVLEKRGYEVRVVGDGKQAIDALEDGVFDVVLMDVQMPVMDGFEATSAIRRREQQRGGHIPVIAMTANAMKGDREHCLENGFDDYTSKPIQWTQLMTVIETLGRKSN